MNTKKYSLVMLTLCVCYCSMVDTAQAQTATGQIAGLVSDPSGGAVPSADITVMNSATGLQRKTKSNGEGNYTVPLLQPGNYRLIVQKEGFRPSAKSDIELGVNQSLTQDVVLTIGAVSDTVQVSATAAELMQSTSSELGTVIAEKPIKDLPLNGRNFTQLLTLAPGVNAVETTQGAGATTCTLCQVAIPGSSFSRPSVNGQWSRSNMFLLDGIVNSHFLSSGYAVLPIVDASQEFKVQSHNDKAQYGGVLGGVVNVVSKSGTNQLHGSTWEYLRNNAFDARDPFKDAARTSPVPYRQNMFGATVGGPVYIPKVYDGRNRTFFFFAYEGWRYNQAQQSLGRVPTDKELSGDFSDSIAGRSIFDPLSTRQDPNNPSALIRTQFPNNVIPPNRISPMMTQYFQAYYDRPNYTADPFFNAVNPNSVKSDSDTYQIRLDHRLKEKDSLWFRYTAFNNQEVAPGTLKSSNLVNRPRTNFGGGDTHIFSPSVFLDVRFGYAFQPWHGITDYTNGTGPAEKAGFGGVSKFGIPGVTLQAPWGGGFQSNGSGISEQDDSYYHAASNLTWVKGSHNLNFGFQVVPEIRAVLPPAGGQGYNFNDAQTANPQQIGTTGASLASALLGLPAQVSYSQQNYRYSWPTWGLYAQDEWKVRKNLTVTMGLRYDRFSPPHMTKGIFTLFDMATGDWLIGGGKLPPPCTTAKAAPCIPGDGTLASLPFGSHIKLADTPDIRHAGTKDFGPRMGIAWRPSDKIVVRGGYGLVFDVFTGLSQETQNFGGWWPDAQNVQLTENSPGQPLTFINDLQNLQVSPLPGPSPWGVQAWFPDPHKKDQYSHQWNVEIQRQMTGDLMLSVAYVGSASRNLEMATLANNAPTPGPGTPDQVNARRPYPYNGTVFFDTSGGKSSYNSLQVRAERRFSQGFQFLVGYTFSKSLDNGTSGWFGAENGVGSASASLQDPAHPEASRSVSSFDVPHYLTASGIYELPFGKGKRWLQSGPAAWVLGGWQTNTILTARSGQPYNLAVIGDVANLGNNISWWNYARPNLVGNPRVSHPTVQQAFNPDAFSVPSFSFGNFGRNVLRTNHVANVDFSLFKAFPLWKETSKLEIRAEAFNMFNIMNYGAPSGLIGTPDAARITSLVQLPRQLQLAAKIVF
jgi:hypothetical protein